MAERQHPMMHIRWRLHQIPGRRRLLGAPENAEHNAEEEYLSDVPRHDHLGEAFDRKLDDAFLVLDEIGNRIVASIASEIETVERNRAILKPPTSLDAWEAALEKT